MKRANVLPLYKDGDPTSFNNYRPVSLLSVVSKVLERVMYVRCIKFIEKHNILYDRQFGFRQNHSTTHALSGVEFHDGNHGKCRDFFSLCRDAL